MAKKLKIKKQHIVLIIALGIIILGLLFSINLKNSKKIISTDNVTLSENSKTNQKYIGEYISFEYPENWYNWYSGKTNTLDQAQIHSTSQESRDKVKTDIQILVSKTDLKTSPNEELKNFAESFEKDRKINKPNNLQYIEVSSNAEVQGYQAVVITEKYSSIFENSYQFSAYLTKTILFYRNDIKYYITYYSYSPSDEQLDELMNRDLPVLEQVLKSLEFKK